MSQAAAGQNLAVAPAAAGTQGQYLGPGDVGYNSNDAFNGIFQPNPNFGAPISGPPPPAPFVPPAAVTTPAQNASTFVPPPNTAVNAPAAMSNADIGNMFPGLTAQGFNSNPGKGAGKGPISGQPTVPAITNFQPQQMDFHQQLQDFINTGLLGGQSRLQ